MLSFVSPSPPKSILENHASSMLDLQFLSSFACPASVVVQRFWTSSLSYISLRFVLLKSPNLKNWMNQSFELDFDIESLSSVKAFIYFNDFFFGFSMARLLLAIIDVSKFLLIR